MNAGYLLFGGLSVVALHAAAQEGKADRYREMLLKKPENAVVFGRLVDAWLVMPATTPVPGGGVLRRI